MPYAAKQHGSTRKARRPRYKRPHKVGHPFYSGKRWRAVRKLALLSDNYTCVKCGDTPRQSRNLHVDHIIPREKNHELEYELDNLQTLCIACHNRKTHGKSRNAFD